MRPSGRRKKKLKSESIACKRCIFVIYIYNMNFSMAEIERDLDVIFVVIPTSGELSSKLAAKKVYVFLYFNIL